MSEANFDSVYGNLKDVICEMSEDFNGRPLREDIADIETISNIIVCLAGETDPDSVRIYGDPLFNRLEVEFDIPYVSVRDTTKSAIIALASISGRVNFRSLNDDTTRATFVLEGVFEPCEKKDEEN